MSVTYHTARVANPGKRKRGKSPKVSPRKRAAANRGPRSTRKHTTRKRAKRPAEAVANPLPPVIATLGAVNPHEGGTHKMAKTKSSQRHGRKRGASYGRKRTRKASDRNPQRAHRRRSIRSRSRNPLFGNTGGVNMGKMVIGGLAGVTLAKVIPVMLPGTLTSSPILRIITTGAVAFLSGQLAGKAMGGNIGDAVAFGGYMQTASIALNTLVPTIGSQIGLGYLTEGNVALPYNPVSTAPLMLPPANAAGVNGIGGFPNAF